MNMRYPIMSFSLVTLLTVNAPHVHASLEEGMPPASAKCPKRVLFQTSDADNPAKKVKIEGKERISPVKLRKLIASNPSKIRNSASLQKQVMEDYYNGILTIPTNTIVNLLPNLTQDCISNHQSTYIFIRHMLEKGDVIPQYLFEKINFAASQGDPKAQFDLAIIYQNGWLRPDGSKQRPNFPKAFILFKDAATQGHIKAQVNLGILFQYGWTEANGNRLQPDPVTAIEYYMAAAIHGYPPAQNNLGVLLQDGWLKADGSRQTGNPEKALQWYIAAAEQGFSSAFYNLGVMVHDGWQKTDGSRQIGDPEKALKFFTAAAKQGHATAQDRVSKILGNELKKLR